MKFNDKQIDAISSRGNVVVMASAGSGKTTVIINRTKKLIMDGINPNEILLVTFSRKARETLQDRLKKIGLEEKVVNQIHVETFHSMALKIIMEKYPGKYKVWDTQWEREKVIKDILHDMNLEDTNSPNKYVKVCFNFISKQKNMMLGINDTLCYKGIHTNGLTRADLKTVFTKYEIYKYHKNLIEFDDFLNIVYNIFDKDKDILKRYQDKYKYIMADEFQDVNMNQALVLQQLNKSETMIVGDPLQAIYAFRGGDSKYILDFDKDYPDVTVVNLDTNYRCKQSIVESSNEFAAQWISDTKHRNYVESKADRKGGRAPSIKMYGSEQREANGICYKILDNKLIPGNVAVLTRTNAQLQPIQNALVMNNIPFQMPGGQLYTNQMEIKILLGYLRLAFNTDDNEAFEYIYNKPNRWLGKAFLDEVKANMTKKDKSYYNAMETIARRNWKFKRGITEIYSVIESMQRMKYKTVKELIDYIRDVLPIDDFVNKDVDDQGECNERIESMDVFAKMCEQYTSVKELLDFINGVTESENQNSVKLLTIHKSKGMEFPIVFMAGVKEEKLPHAMNDNLEDEAKVMYVGMTRAADKLYISYTDFPSRFIINMMPYEKREFYKHEFEQIELQRKLISDKIKSSENIFHNTLDNSQQTV